MQQDRQAELHEDRVVNHHPPPHRASACDVCDACDAYDACDDASHPLHQLHSDLKCCRRQQLSAE